MDDGSGVIAPGKTSDDGGHLLFLSGADMHPTAIVTAYEGAMFVARGRLDEGGDTGAPASAATEDVWGILLRMPDLEVRSPGEERPVVVDDGRSFRARVVTPTGDAADPVATIAAARYWELPPSYVDRLRRRVDSSEAGIDDL